MQRILFSIQLTMNTYWRHQGTTPIQRCGWPQIQSPSDSVFKPARIWRWHWRRILWWLIPKHTRSSLAVGATLDRPSGEGCSLRIWPVRIRQGLYHVTNHGHSGSAGRMICSKWGVVTQLEWIDSCFIRIRVLIWLQPFPSPVVMGELVMGLTMSVEMKVIQCFRTFSYIYYI